MKKAIKIITGVFLFAVMFYSCESNDSIVNNANNGTAKSKALIEFFTAVNCPNCPPPGYFLDNIDSLKGVTINDTNVIIIRYHSNYNGYDPYYLFNPAGSVARHNYYSFFWNPAGSIMGSNMPNFDQTAWLNIINTQLEKQNSIQTGIVVSSFDTVSRAGTISLSMRQTGGTGVSDLRLFVAVTENELYYQGTNGEKHHQNTYRDFLTGTDGESITLQPGVLLNKDINYILKDGINFFNSHIVIFLQSQGSKEVFGVDRVKLM
jgi:hypothetical protein